MYNLDEDVREVKLYAKHKNRTGIFIKLKVYQDRDWYER